VKCGGAGEPSLCECERGDVEVTLGCIRAALSAMGDSWSCLSCLGVEEPPVSCTSQVAWVRLGGSVNPVHISLPRVHQPAIVAYSPNE